LAKGNVVFAGAVVDMETNCWIPFDDANTDYQQYLAWLAEGNTPEPWENQ
jgi:hypothetical protein